jgi:hypothetical protein
MQHRRDHPEGNRLDDLWDAQPSIRRRPGALADHTPHRLPAVSSHDETAQAEAIS